MLTDFTILALSLSATGFKDSYGIRNSVRYWPAVFRDQFKIRFQDTPKEQASAIIIQDSAQRFTEECRQQLSARVATLSDRALFANPDNIPESFITCWNEAGIPQYDRT
ncbi:MAG: hypothetical protein JEZ11_27255 [Desulfobacterales bacterium]|nr:hypothetical protein [Desulfobacterales bacterium]